MLASLGIYDSDEQQLTMGSGDGDYSRDGDRNTEGTTSTAPRGDYYASEALPHTSLNEELDDVCTPSSAQAEDIAQNPPSDSFSMQDEAPPAQPLFSAPQGGFVHTFSVEADDTGQEKEDSWVSRGIPAHGHSPSLEFSSGHESDAGEEVLTEQIDSTESAGEASHETPMEQPLYEDASLNSRCHEGPAEQSHASEDEELSDDVKRKMVTDLCKGAVILTREHGGEGGSSHVYLIGTAHVSEESCREVQAVTSIIKPEVVFLELCNKRRFILERTSFQAPTVAEMINAWRERRMNLLGILYSWFLEKVAAKLDVLPGSEFRAAFEEANACGARVVLGDRDVEVTLRRTWGKMSSWYKTKFVVSMLFHALWLPTADTLNEMMKNLQDADMLTVAFEDLGKSYPSLMKTLVDERDMYMAAVLHRIAEYHSSVVAVVGRGHVAGITKYWGQDIPIHALMEIPKKKSSWNSTSKLCALTACLALTSSLVYAYYH